MTQGVVEVVKRVLTVHGRIQDETVGVLGVLEVVSEECDERGHGGLGRRIIKGAVIECDKVPCGMRHALPTPHTHPACLPPLASRHQLSPQSQPMTMVILSRVYQLPINFGVQSSLAVVQC